MSAQSKRAPHEFEGRWYHCVSTTYGAWLYGDARGFRTRHHRRHVDGDYKHRPPADSYTHTRATSVYTAAMLRPRTAVAIAAAVALSAISYQRSAISDQLSAISDQRSAQSNEL